MCLDCSANLHASRFVSIDVLLRYILTAVCETSAKTCQSHAFEQLSLNSVFEL